MLQKKKLFMMKKIQKNEKKKKKKGGDSSYVVRLCGVQFVLSFQTCIDYAVSFRCSGSNGMRLC